jgi:hypothetical protein
LHTQFEQQSLGNHANGAYSGGILIFYFLEQPSLILSNYKQVYDMKLEVSIAVERYINQFKTFGKPNESVPIHDLN